MNGLTNWEVSVKGGFVFYRVCFVSTWLISHNTMRMAKGKG